MSALAARLPSPRPNPGPKRRRDKSPPGYYETYFESMLLMRQRRCMAFREILSIGAGGAARAAVFGLRERNAEVWVMNRTAENGQKLARQAHAHYVSHAHLKKLEFDVIINATPLGMEGSRPQSPLDESDLRT